MKRAMTRSRRPDIIRMNECSACGAHPCDPCHPNGSHMEYRNHPERIALSLSLFELIGTRQYVDARTTPYGNSVRSPECEHCDGEKSAWTRKDDLRGWVCPFCDLALDEMIEGSPS